jgi:glucokinase
MGKQNYVGVDIGGTTIKIAFINLDGNIVDKWEIPTNTANAGVNITGDIASSITEKLTSAGNTYEDLIGIGIGAPGFIEMETGFIYKAVNIGWENFALREELEKETNLPVIVDNDANIAALGEMWMGAGDGAKDLLAVTLGTGVGGGIVANGTIVHGTNGMAGEIGHLTAITDGGYLCNCGKHGCLETIASATGIARIATEGLENHQESSLHAQYQKTGTLTAKDVFDAAKLSDKWALEVIDQICFHLGLAIANLANAINPGKIVISGGVSKAGDTLLVPLKKYFQKFALPRVAEGADFAIAQLGNDAGVIGGAWLVKTKLANK